MSQNDMIIANAPGGTVRADINNALQALASTSKGNSAPGTPYAGQLWLDDNTPSSSVWSLSMYDGTDWIKLGELDTVNNVFNAQGSTTNDTPNSGMVGEYISSSLGSGAAIALISNTSANIVSIALPSGGNYELWGTLFYKGGNTTTVTTLQAEITTTSATISGTVGKYGNVVGAGATLFNGGSLVPVPINPFPFNVTGPTTVYLVANAIFGASTCSGFGIIQARRAR